MANKINFSGNIDNPKANILQTIVIVLQNAFIQALQPSIDDQINLGKLAKGEEDKKGFFKSLFASDKKKK